MIGLINGLIEFRFNKYFEYLSYVGYIYLGKVLFHSLVDFRFYFLKKFSKKNFVKKYGQGWVIITEGSYSYVNDITVEFLKMGFKVLLIGNDEKKIKNNITTIYEKAKIHDITLEYFIFDFYGEDKILSCEKYNIFVNQLVKIISTDNISVILHNVDFHKNCYFDKLKNSEITKTINANLVSSYVICKFLNDFLFFYKREKKTLLIGMNNHFINFKIPYLQIYTASKKHSKKLFFDLKNVDICYIEDGISMKTTHTDNFFNKIISPSKFSKNGIFLNYSNKLKCNISNSCYLLQFYYRYYLKMQI